jgi:hypothetical protein
MLTFIVSEYGSIPSHSSIYEGGYEIIAKEDILVKSLDSINIHTGLILKCNLSDFIHIVMDDSYHNILKIENNIIEKNINLPYDIKIINLTNNNINIPKNNKICHFYSKNKALLYNTIIQDINIQKTEVKEEVVEEVKEEVKEEVVEEVKEEVKEETKHEEVVEEVKEETKHEVVVEETKHEEVVEETKHEVVVEETKHEVVVEAKHEEVVEETKHEEVVEETKHEEVVVEAKHEEVVEEGMSLNNTELTQSQINANIAKRKYIRKKKMVVNI